MTDYIIQDEWKIIENKFDPSVNQISESLFSLGNGRMGQRGNFEESYTGKSLQGNYIAGVYYPDKTRVGWWKNGYPEYFAKVLNAANWMGLSIQIDGEELDLAQMQISEFYRALDMKEGHLSRKCIATFSNGKSLEINSIRFYSIADDEAAAYRFEIKALNFSGKIAVTSFIDGDIKNEDSNYDEKFWDEVEKEQNGTESFLTIRTKKTAFDVCTTTSIKAYLDDEQFEINSDPIEKEKWIGQSFELDIPEGSTFSFEKIAINLSSENYAKEELLEQAHEKIQILKKKGFEKMLSEQITAWNHKWENSDIIIEGDVAAQQAIRFNIFQLNQTYTGEDARLNIGPKGFTGEKYGGTTYWDTEAYCLPFYLSTAEENVSRNLLVYRHNHLQKAIENAAKLGFKDGAALYPMVTINGEECHNEWEITFEEIHRNAAIAFAIFRYISYTGDKSYLKEFGLDVLIGIARFWAQRVNWSEQRNQYVMLGVTGPNEYENNINNNWYTSSMAVWCLEYTLTALELVKNMDAARYQEILDNTHFQFEAETEKWQHIIENMYLPEDKEKGIFLQQDNYLDKEQILAKDLPKEDRPLNQKWSWDRILRSCFIKQADVLQGFYFLEDKFDLETLRRNFDFYEPRTVHESSLSPCVHSILAAKLGDEKRAYEFYLRTSRLDLDNYNNDTDDGLHITSMAGTWMSVVEGFGGMRVRENQLQFQPFLPENWTSFSFQIRFRNSLIKVSVNKENTTISLLSGAKLEIKVWNECKLLTTNEAIIWEMPLVEQ